MIEREGLYRRRCVRKLIEVVESVPGQWRAESPTVLDETTAGFLLVASWLRCERDFLFQCFEEMGVEIADLSRRIDGLLGERKVREDDRQGQTLSPSDCPPALSELTAKWLDRAAEEASLLRQDYLGVEHLLLAFLRSDETPLARPFVECGIDHRRLMESVLNALRRGRPSGGETAPAASSAGGVQPVGMPKRFSIAIMMAWMTLFAMAFSVLKWISAPPQVFGAVMILMLCIGIAQMWLFGGKKPRLASILAGVVVLTVEVVVLNFATDCFCPPRSSILLRCLYSIILIVPCASLGAFLGYLLGGLTAGIVLTLNYLENRKAAESTKT
jgi:hypothetical protein